VLGQMYAAGSDGTRHIDPVIDDNRGTAGSAGNRSPGQFRQFPAGQVFLPELDPIETGVRGLGYFLELKFAGKAGCAPEAPAIRHVAQQRFTGWREGAHGLAPDAN